MTFPGTLNVLVERLLWQQPRRGLIWPHTGALCGGSWHSCWPHPQWKRHFGFILEIASSEPKPSPCCLLAVAFCLFALFLEYNYSLVDCACPWHCIIVFPAAVVPAIHPDTGNKKTSITPTSPFCILQGVVQTLQCPGLLAPDLCCYLLIKPNYKL